MGSYIVTDPKTGKKYRVTGPGSKEEALAKAKTQAQGRAAEVAQTMRANNLPPKQLNPGADRIVPDPTEQRAAVDRAEFRNLSIPAQADQMVLDAITRGLRGPALGLGEHASAALRYPFNDKPYTQLWQEEQRKTEAARNRMGSDPVGQIAGDTAELGAMAYSLPRAIVKESVNYGGKVFNKALNSPIGQKGRQLLADAMSGAGYSGISASASGGSPDDIFKSMLTGGVITAAGSGGAQLGTGAWDKMRRAIDKFRATGTTRAQQDVYDLGRQLGVTEDTIKNAKLTHGSDTMAADVLGKPGSRMARLAAKRNPEAQEILDDKFAQRQTQETPRVVAGLESVSGVKPGSIQTPDEMAQAAARRAQPGISSAYAAAESAGARLPLAPFRNIMKAPDVKSAYADAARSVKNWTAASGNPVPKTVPRGVARLDATKQILGDQAEAAKRAGKGYEGGSSGSLSRELKELIDANTTGPEYAKARAKARQLAVSKEAIEAGADAAAARPGFDAIGRAGRAERAEDKLMQRQAYTQAFKDRQAKAAQMQTPQGQAAIAEVFGNRAPRVQQLADTAQTFSDTARQYTKGAAFDPRSEFAGALGAGGAGWAAQELLGYTDPKIVAPAALGGLLLARSGKPFVQKSINRGNFAKSPEIARLMTSGPEAIPLQSPLPQRQSMSPASRDLFARMMMAAGIYGQQEE